VALRTPLVALLTFGALLTATSSSAGRPPLIDRSDPCGCNPVLVGWGHSQGGQEWGQRYGVYKKTSYLMLSLPDAQGHDNGGGSAWDGWTRKRLFTISFAGDFAEPDPEMVSGAAADQVHELRFAFSDGPTLVVHPKKASSRLRHRFRFLQHVRFYSLFYASSEGTLQTVTAYDGSGRKLKTGRFA
jgi:hypothetical protein